MGLGCCWFPQVGFEAVYGKTPMGRLQALSSRVHEQLSDAKAARTHAQRTRTEDGLRSQSNPLGPLCHQQAAAWPGWPSLRDVIRIAHVRIKKKGCITERMLLVIVRCAPPTGNSRIFKDIHTRDTYCFAKPDRAHGVVWYASFAPHGSP